MSNQTKKVFQRACAGKLSKPTSLALKVAESVVAYIHKTFRKEEDRPGFIDYGNKGDTVVFRFDYGIKVEIYLSRGRRDEVFVYLATVWFYPDKRAKSKNKICFHWTRLIQLNRDYPWGDKPSVGENPYVT